MVANLTNKASHVAEFTCGDCVSELERIAGAEPVDVVVRCDELPHDLGSSGAVPLQGVEEFGDFDRPVELRSAPLVGRARRTLPGDAKPRRAVPAPQPPPRRGRRYPCAPRRPGRRHLRPDVTVGPGGRGQRTSTGPARRAGARRPASGEGKAAPLPLVMHLCPAAAATSVRAAPPPGGRSARRGPGRHLRCR